MRHQIKGKKLNRNSSQRKALFRNLLQALFLHEEIKTTLAKAKVIKRIADKLISKSKNRSLSVRRQLLAFFPDKIIAKKLMDDIGPRFKDRNSGFTKIVRTNRRKGDNVIMAKIELVEKKKEQPKTDSSQDKNKKDSKKSKKEAK